MNEEEQIKEIERELNAKKDSVVHNTRIFMKEVVELAIKEKQSEKKEAEKMAMIAEKTKPAAMADIPPINITGGGPTPIIPNDIKIISPVAKDSPYKNAIPIQFKVSGPHHTSNKDYVYTIMVYDKTNKVVFNQRGATNRADFTHPTQLNLPDGTYKIQLATADPVAKKMLARSKEEIFVVDLGGGGPGPINIINNIYINNNFLPTLDSGVIYYTDKFPFAIPFKIRFVLSDLKYIAYFTDLVNINFRIIDDAGHHVGRWAFSDTFMMNANLEYTLKDKNTGNDIELPFDKEGVYKLLIILTTNKDNKELFRRVVPIHVKNRGGPVGPTKKGNAVFSVIVGGKDIKSGNTFTTEIKPGEKSMIKIRNSGTGGNLVWRSNSDPWIKVTPSQSSKPMKKGKDDEVIIEVDRTKLAALRNPDVKHGRVLIEGAYGTKINPEDWKTIAGKCLINFELK